MNEKEETKNLNLETINKEESTKSSENDSIVPNEELKITPTSAIQIEEDLAKQKWNPFTSKSPRYVNKDNVFETRLLEVKRVIKVTKGGRRFKFYALVVVGDKKGRVGYASAKDIEIPIAISKAEQRAKKNLHRVKIIGSSKTIAHDLISKHCSAKVLLKPAQNGKGIIASNNIRVVVELAGYKNIYSKNLGTSNSKNVVIATIKGLTSMKSKDEIMLLRDLTTL